MILKKWIAVNVALLTLAAQTGAVADELRSPDSGRGNVTNQIITSDEVVTPNDTVTTDRTFNRDEPFPAHQLSLQTFGTYASRDRTGDSHNRLGAGVGLTYFFTRYVGIGADSYVEEWKLPYRLNGSLILRLPLGDRFSHWALYGFGGGGRQFKDVPQYTWHGGGGAEYNINRNIGIFADARQVFPDKTPDYLLVRAGLNFGF